MESSSPPLIIAMNGNLEVDSDCKDSVNYTVCMLCAYLVTLEFPLELLEDPKQALNTHTESTYTSKHTVKLSHWPPG